MKPKNSLLLLILYALLVSSVPRPATSIPTESVDTLLSLLRRSGHTLFANAISTSDLLFDILSLPSLTLFAPSNPSLFALDMAHTSSFYLTTLRLHVIPSRLLLHLNELPNNISFHTLLPSRDLHVTNYPLQVDGVDVVFPSLYSSRFVVVYQLRGLLPSSSVATPPLSVVQPVRRSPRNSKNRRINPVPYNQSILPPSPNNNLTNRTGFPLSPVNTTVSPRFPASPINRTISPPRNRGGEAEMSKSGDSSGTVSVRKNGKCEPSDGKFMQCSVEGDGGQLSFHDDYTLRHYMTDYTL